MTSASRCRHLLALLGLLTSACNEGGSVLPDRYRGVNVALPAVANRAPMVASFTMDSSRRECRVDHWRDLHPDQPERAWAMLTRLEIIETGFLHDSISGYAAASFVFGPWEQVLDAGSAPSLVAVAPSDTVNIA